MAVEITVEDIIDVVPKIVDEARTAAHDAANKFLGEKLNGKDQFPCGFAWTNIYGFGGKKIRKNSKLGKALIAAGVRQDYNRVFQIWNPSGLGVQNVDVKDAGAMAAADVFNRFGFDAGAGSRWD